MKDLVFQPKKTKGQFLDNYALHDLAGEYVKEIMSTMGITVIPYGGNRRHETVWEDGSDKPDALLWKPGLHLAFIDWKGHRQREWILNKRAYDAYLLHAKKFNLPIFCIWVIIPEVSILYAKLPFRRPEINFKEHDLNEIIIADPILDIFEIKQLPTELAFSKQASLFPEKNQCQST